MNLELGKASDFLTYASPSPKWIFNKAGLLVSGSTLRCDHDPVTHEALGIRVEGQRTNLLLHSEDFANAKWEMAIQSVVTFTPEPSPVHDGLACRVNVVSSTLFGTGGIRQSIPIAAETDYTVSCYLEGEDAVQLSLENGTSSYGSPNTITIDLASGAITGAQASNAVATPCGNGYLVSLYLGKSKAGATIANVELRVAVGSSFLVAMPGFEGGTFPSSYIPTEASAVTRAADVIGLPMNFPYNPSAGTYIIEAASSVAGGAYRNLLHVTSGTSNANRNPDLAMGTGPNGTTGIMRCDVVDDTAFQAAIGSQGTIVVGQFYKGAFAYAENDFALVMDGGTPDVDSSGTVPAVDKISIGSRLGGNQLNGWIRSIVYLPRRLSNTELQARTL